MAKGIRLWVMWLAALTVGIYGTGLVYDGTIGHQYVKLVYGIPILLLGIWVTGNILASAKQAFRRQRALAKASSNKA